MIKKKEEILTIKDKVEPQLPLNWLLTTIGEVGIISSGGTPSTKNLRYWEGDISWITPADLSKYTKKFISKGSRCITKDGLEESSAKLLPKGTVLFSSRAPIGYTVIANNDLATNQGFKNLITTESLLSEYVYYYFKTLKPLAETVSSGTTFLELSASKFAKLPFPLAPLVEQTKIVTKIEELFINLEYTENDLQDTLKKLEMYRYSLLNEIFNQKSKTRKIIKLKDLGTILTGGTPSKNKPEFYGSEYNFYKPSDLTAYGKIYESKDKLSHLGYNSIRHVPKDSILVSCIGTIGKIGLIKEEGAFNQQINAIVPDDKYLPEFIFYQAISLNFQNLLKDSTSATTISIINKSKFSQLDFVYYNIEEQKTMVQEIDYKFSIIDNLKLTIESSLEKIKLTRAKILDDAFKGKLIPQIEGVDNAKVLLKKIQKEKSEYLEQQRHLEKNKVKKRKFMDNKLSILEILEKENGLLLINDLWQQSIFKDDIEKFYSELKRIEQNIIIENNNKNSFIRIKNENK